MYKRQKCTFFVQNLKSWTGCRQDLGVFSTGSKGSTSCLLPKFCTTNVCLSLYTSFCMASMAKVTGDAWSKTLCVWFKGINQSLSGLQMWNIQHMLYWYELHTWVSYFKLLCCFCKTIGSWFSTNKLNFTGMPVLCAQKFSQLRT